MSETDEILAELFLHDTRSGFLIIDFAIDEKSEGESSDLQSFKNLVEEARSEVEERGLESAEGLYDEIASYQDNFSGEVGGIVDKMASCTDIVSNYLADYSDGQDVSLGELGNQLEEYGAEIDYNGLEDVELEADSGVVMAFNTLGINQEKHNSEDCYWAEFEVEDDETVVGYLWDEGPGLPEEYGEEEIFDKDVGDGTGKGLYLADQIIEANGGNIEYDETLSDSGGFGLKIELPLSTEYQNLNKEETPSATH